MRIVLVAASLVMLTGCGGEPEAPMTPLRAGEIRECVGEIEDDLAPGSDVNRLCTCATPVDYFKREKLRQCAEQTGIQPRRYSSSWR